MAEIPDDIRETAVRVYSQYLKDIGSLSLVDLLADALMQEREQCAKIADMHAAMERNPDIIKSGGGPEARAKCVDAVASAIRALPGRFV